MGTCAVCTAAAANWASNTRLGWDLSVTVSQTSSDSTRDSCVVCRTRLASSRTLLANAGGLSCKSSGTLVDVTLRFAVCCTPLAFIAVGTRVTSLVSCFHHVARVALVENARDGVGGLVVSTFLTPRRTLRTQEAGRVDDVAILALLVEAHGGGGARNVLTLLAVVGTLQATVPVTRKRVSVLAHRAFDVPFGVDVAHCAVTGTLRACLDISLVRRQGVTLADDTAGLSAVIRAAGAVVGAFVTQSVRCTHGVPYITLAGHTPCHSARVRALLTVVRAFVTRARCTVVRVACVTSG